MNKVEVDLLPAREINHHVRSERCPACALHKTRGRAFCVNCFRRLNRDEQKHLYAVMTPKFPAAFCVALNLIKNRIERERRA